MTHATQSISVESLLGKAAGEFTERLNRGEQPSIEEYTRRYPEIAEVIRETFPALQMVTPCKSDGGEETIEPDSHARGARLLGDFRIIREVGRGGMGVVYEAEQISLGRHVALKVLQGSPLADVNHLARFEREARAAAKLHHTNIVPVFGVGHDGGVHYYVMQFIQGQPLNDVCLLYTSPSPRDGLLSRMPSSA